MHLRLVLNRAEQSLTPSSANARDFFRHLQKTERKNCRCCVSCSTQHYRLNFSDTFVIENRMSCMEIVHKIMHKMGVCECDEISEQEQEPEDEAKTDGESST